MTRRHLTHLRKSRNRKDDFLVRIWRRVWAYGANPHDTHRRATPSETLAAGTAGHGGRMRYKAVGRPGPVGRNTGELSAAD